MSQKILITGASGLLGREVYRVCKAHSDWTLVGLGLSRCGEQFKKIDLTDDIRVQEIIHEHQVTMC